ncbi:MAG: tyrosine-protein phosphatase [Flammeovirgaceae bacterium]
MKQLNTIEKLKTLFPTIDHLEAAILYGSFGRKTANPNSDIDIQLVVNDGFDQEAFQTLLEQAFKDEIKQIHPVELRAKIVFYFKLQPKLEFSIHYDLSSIKRNYLGSEITDVAHSILYHSAASTIKDHLQQLVRSKEALTLQEQVNHLIDKFIYEFESCSNMQRRSDGYQFYYFYNIALHVVVQLHQLSKGATQFNFLPKNFLATLLDKDQLKLFYGLQGTLYLPEANRQKRRLLDFFYASIAGLVHKNQLLELKDFCEWVFHRDYFWNFRDISKYNQKIRDGKIFRTATLSFFQNEKQFDELLEHHQITTIIDLRASREIEQHPYSNNTLKKFNYVNAPFDPWNQPDWFKEQYQYGTNEEIAYRFFTLACRDKIKQVVEAIINTPQSTVAIHCFAGKDRTGIVITLLHLLIATPLDAIYADYLASEIDVKLSLINITLNIIDEEGGINAYLLNCGLSQLQIDQLKTILLIEDVER